MCLNETQEFFPHSLSEMAGVKDVLFWYFLKIKDCEGVYLTGSVMLYSSEYHI
jgi:hypothetical protein